MDDQNQQNPNPPTSGEPKQQIAERLKQANNVLVTVSTNPSVDQLAACIGLTLILNKMDKHATAVFSGEMPSTIEFLQPEQTLEKTTDSLRDFIISLDKAKADKLRYKVEDKVVKIFITPYRTSISEKDLEFSQGDFNVDVVVALGVHEQKDLDQAITAHGRILHDATVTTISTATPSTLGSLNWQDASSSSLSELITTLCNDLGPNLLDGQIATALLTGIVAETARFSNEKTTPRTMSASATLMSAGANQQLVATKLEPPKPLPSLPEPEATTPTQPPSPTPEPPAKPSEVPKGTLEVAHEQVKAPASTEEGDEQSSDWLLKQQQIRIDDESFLHKLSEGSSDLPTDSKAPTNTPVLQPEPHIDPQTVTQPPAGTNGTQISTANPVEDGQSTEALTLPKVEQPLPKPSDGRANPLQPSPPEPPQAEKTLDEIEESVGSVHTHQVNDSRNAAASLPSTSQPEVLDLNSLSSVAREAAAPAEPLTPAAFGSQYAFDNLHPNPALPDDELTAPPATIQPFGVESPPFLGNEAVPGSSPADQPPTMPLPPNFPPSLVSPTAPGPQSKTDALNNSLDAPPPVPPPLYGPSTSNNQS